MRAHEPDGEPALGDIEEERQHAECASVVRRTLVAPMLPLPRARNVLAGLEADQQVTEGNAAEQVSGDEDEQWCHGMRE